MGNGGQFLLVPSDTLEDNMSVQESTDVVVVGFGPVGKLLAIKLGRAGHRVVVVDRQQKGYPLPRAVTHDAEFARILQSIGLPPTSIPEITQPYDDMYVWKNQSGETLLEVDWSGHGTSGWNNTYFFNQPDLEDRLDQIVATLPNVQVRRGWLAIDHADGLDAVSVTLRDEESQVQKVVTAQYLVGADGATSKVRERMRGGWHDLGYFFDWLVVDVQPKPELQFPHVATQTCDVARPCTMVPGGPGRRRWEFMLLPHEKAEDLNRTDRAWELLQPYGINPENATLERHSVYTFHAGWAQQWRRGRVMIAGDAAHLMPPFAGQGLGAGVRDVMNLAWKLDAVLSGTASDTLLDTYGPERTAHVSAFIDFSMTLGKVICITDPDEAAQRDERMKADRAAGQQPPAPPNPTLGAGAHFSPNGGTLSRQYRVVAGAEPQAEPVPLDDLLGGPGVLLLRDEAMVDLISAAHRAQLTRAGVPVRGLVNQEASIRDEALLDTEQGYGKWLDELNVAAVLIRPDFYLFDTADTAADLDSLIERFGATLAGTPLAGHRYGQHSMTVSS